MQPLPPLNALRAFEAAARHLSLAKAADELNVTPSAVSHQVKQLEEFLGVPLFHRMTRRVSLTEAGQACLPLLSEAFGQIRQAIALVGEAAGTGDILTVSLPPSFAAKWLIPKLDKFRQLYRDIDVRISPSLAFANFRSDDVDVAVRFGAGDYPDLMVDRLFMEQYAPLCSPALCEGDKPLRTPADLAHHTLLHDDSAHLCGPGPDWRMWLKLAGHDDIDADRGPRFSFPDHALQAAAAGQGVVLGRLSLAREDIDAGRLAQPFSGVLPARLGYFLVRPKLRREPDKVTAFRDWILAEAARESGDEGADVRQSDAG